MALKRRSGVTVVPARLDQQRHTGEVRQDPEHYITCAVVHPVKSYTITFDPAKLQEKIDKYGKALIVPQKLKKRK